MLRQRGAARPSSKDNDMNLQERLTAFALLGATWVMWLLVGLSVIGLAIVLERAYYLATTKDDVPRLRRDMLDRLRSGDLKGLMALLSEARSFEARVVRAGLEGAEQGGADSAEERMSGESQLARLFMEKNLAFLGTVGNNAPFVGLLGTVIGVIGAFQQLNNSQGQVTQGLMAEIGEALVATAIGILVALPSVAFFNLFQRIIRGRMLRADAMGKDLLAYLRGQRSGNAAPNESRPAAAAAGGA